MADASLFQQVLDYRNRADPYPLYARLREEPVVREADGSFVVTRYREIVSLLHDPRMSSDMRKRDERFAAGQEEESDEVPGLPPTFLRLDPPDHDRLRRLAMRGFGPPHAPRLVSGSEVRLRGIVTALLDGVVGRDRIDVVDDIAYPFPVAVICGLLGVPPEDEPRFRGWVDAVVGSMLVTTAEQQRARREAVVALREYLGALVAVRRETPGTDLLSGFAADEGPEHWTDDGELLATAALLLVAGHETTVNLVANGMLTLLRHPDALDRLRAEPDFAIRMVEELLRYEPPVQLVSWRTPLEDVEVAGVRIPAGVPVTLLLASGNRDPAHIDDPELFVPDRPTIEHLGFGGGIHYCFGAPLARLEAQIALTELARRLERPRLVVDPPPYRPSPVLRGPRHLLVDVDGVRPAMSV
ncbi:cytochrome P450 [Rhodococcus sp. LBL1]|nr:cytochrome P450 [Rhodococcus sp. LBL1]MDH6684829.1 cytochrome P450 [Rhodococcus sp. LBL2]